MSGHEDAAAATEQPQDGELQDGERAGVTRRSALRTAAGAGLAAGALAATSGGASALASARPAARGAAEHEADSGASGAEPVVAHLRNARTGEIDLFHGTSQVRVHDRALASALLRHQP